MRRRFRESFDPPIVAGILVVLSLAPALVAQNLDPASPAFFSKNIQPVLEQKCFKCHKPGSNVSRLYLTTREALMEGGDNGPAVVPGQPSRSLLYRSITHQSQPFMPMGMDRLPQDVIDNFAAWIEAGAHYGDASGAESREDDRRAKGRQLFKDHVQPLLESTCLKCHSPETKASGLDLSTRDAMLAGGKNGKVLEPGQPGASKLYKSVAHLAEPHMPFRSEKLSRETIDRLGEWIETGAPFEGVLKRIRPTSIYGG